MNLFGFPGEAEWNEVERAVEFCVEVGDYKGRVFVPLALFQSLAGRRPSPEAAVALFHANRTQLELLAEARVRDRALDADGHIRLVGRDLKRLSRRSAEDG